MKILILCSYYNRPLLVINALKSILKADQFHSNWHLAFGDDGSKIPGKPIVENILKDHLDKVTFYNSEMKFENKIEQGLIIGKMANLAMKESNADIAIVLCDDDELVPTYLKDIVNFFSTNTDVLYCYSKIILYNPLLNKSEDVSLNLDNKWNKFNDPINPVNKIDASQVAWRLSCCKDYGAWFEESTKLASDKPWIKDTDKSFFENLFEKCGLCYPTEIPCQYKGIHDYQLVWHKNTTLAGLKTYNEKCEELGGIEF